MSFSIEEKYETEIKLGEGKVIHIRKWKQKDRKNFKNMFIEKGEFTTAMDLAATVVFPCILEKSTLLTEEEIKYVLGELRRISIGETFSFDFVCDECDEFNKIELKISEVNKSKISKWGTSSIKGHSIKFGEQINPQFYYNALFEAASEEDKAVIDLVSHIISIDNDDTKTFKELVSMFENMDTDIYDAIIEEFNKQKFKQDLVTEVECTHCKAKQGFLFDEIPGFFPVSWYSF